jgi:hypothetical protein
VDRVRGARPAAAEENEEEDEGGEGAAIIIDEPGAYKEP